MQAAGRDAGLKLMEIKRLREKGLKVTLPSTRRSSGALPGFAARDRDGVAPHAEPVDLVR
jgi:hypothetical protein